MDVKGRGREIRKKTRAEIQRTVAFGGGGSENDHGDPFKGGRKTRQRWGTMKGVENVGRKS